MEVTLEASKASHQFRANPPDCIGLQICQQCGATHITRVVVDKETMFGQAHKSSVGYKYGMTVGHWARVDVQKHVYRICVPNGK